MDRTGHQAFGCFFTSEKFPWPCVEGVPYQPKLQLNLTLIEDELGLNFGGGLLQVFQFSDHPVPQSQWFLLRRIPSEDSSEDSLTPVTPFRGATSDAPPYHFHDYMGLLGGAAGYGMAAVAIEKFSKQTFCVPDSFNDGEVCDFFLLLEDLDSKIHEYLKAEIDQFSSIIDELADYTNETEDGRKICTLSGLHDPGLPLFHENQGDITFFDFESISASINGWDHDSRFDFLHGSGAIFASFDDSANEWTFKLDWNV